MMAELSLICMLGCAFPSAHAAAKFGYYPPVAADQVANLIIISGNHQRLISSSTTASYPLTVQVIGNSGQPLPDTPIAFGLTIFRDEQGIAPTYQVIRPDLLLIQHADSLVIKSDESGLATIRLESIRRPGTYPIAVRSADQTVAFDLQAIGPPSSSRATRRSPSWWWLTGLSPLLLLPLLWRRRAPVEITCP